MPVCRQCQREIPEINQSKFCPYCGTALEEPGLFEFNAESAQPTTPAVEIPPSYSPAASQPYVHWEDRDRLGFLRAFSQTWSDASFRPGLFFGNAPKTGNLGSALLFAFLTGMTSTLLSLVWWVPFSGFEEFETVLGVQMGRDVLGAAVLMFPFALVMLIFVSSAIYHLSLLMLGCSRHGWEATFRAVCYSYGPQLFAIVPWCGGMVATVWQFVIMVIGFRELHETTTGRALFAALLPFLVCCGLAGLLVYRMAEFFSGRGFEF